MINDYNIIGITTMAIITIITIITIISNNQQLSAIIVIFNNSYLFSLNRYMSIVYCISIICPLLYQSTIKKSNTFPIINPIIPYVFSISPYPINIHQPNIKRNKAKPCAVVDLEMYDNSQPNITHRHRVLPRPTTDTLDVVR